MCHKSTISLEAFMCTTFNAIHAQPKVDIRNLNIAVPFVLYIHVNAINILSSLWLQLSIGGLVPIGAML
jgi:hypothetical protein